MRDIVFPFLEHTGAALKSFSKGEAEVELHVQPYHLQHKSFIHGGIISTLMDNTEWYAAVSNLKRFFCSYLGDKDQLFEPCFREVSFNFCIHKMSRQDHIIRHY